MSFTDQTTTDNLPDHLKLPFSHLQYGGQGAHITYLRVFSQQVLALLSLPISTSTQSVPQVLTTPPRGHQLGQEEKEVCPDRFIEGQDF